MLVNLGVALVGATVFLFIFWKRLKEDYSSEIIFKTGSFIFAGIIVGSLASLRLENSLYFWLEFLGALIGLAVSGFTLRVRFYETLEAFVIAILPWISFMFLEDSVTSSSLISFFAFLISLIFIFVFYYLDVHYKSFRWYKSGKIGFSGLATLFLFFLLRVALASARIPVLSFLSSYEMIVSGGVSVLSLGMLINLGIQRK